MESTQAILNALKECELFKTLEDADLDTLIFLAYSRDFSEGDIVYTKGEPSNDRFCMLFSGSVNIVAKDGSIFKRVTGHEVIGEIALSDPHHKRTVTVKAAEPTEVLEWDVNYIKEKMPSIWKKLVKLAWEHISEFYEE